jgi:aspartate kinase
VDDSVIAAGEDLSARLMACALRARGRRASLVDAREVIRTDAQFSRARPQVDELRCLARERLLPMLEAGEVPVVQGFVGAAEDGRTTTLGRGGSDFTAALLGAALDAEVVHIWTDVDGILSGDPRAVDHPRILPEVGFEEAVELAYFGAKVIHPGAAKHAVSHGVPLRIRNTFKPTHAGTLILSDRRGVPDIAAVAYKPRVVLMKVRSHPTALQYGFLARVFEVLGRHQVPVDLVATSHSSTAFTIDQAEAIEELSKDLSDFSDVEVIRGLATITVVGHGLLEEPGIDALVFWAVERTPVHLISQASDVSLSFLVSDEDAAPLVRKLHMTLIELRDENSREQME